MNAKPKSIKETLSQQTQVALVNGQIRAEAAPHGSPRWAYLEGRRVAERILAGIDMAPLVENKAELALHTLVMVRAQRVKHPAVTFDVLINWKAGLAAVVDAAWKAAIGVTR